MNPGVSRPPIAKDYDLFIAVCQFPWDLSALRSLPDWRRRCRHAVCWLEELWPSQVKDLGGFLKVLSEFDHVIVNGVGGHEELKSLLSNSCHYQAPGVDAIRFCPYPDPAPRSVHVYNIGRRSPAIHKALLEQADRERLLYIYDTINTHGPKQTDDYLTHRNLLANIAKRSRYFPVNAAKINRQMETAGSEEFGFRFFEGAAAGSVMFGVAPETDAFRSYFDWPDAVIPVPYDSPDIVGILHELDRQSERLARIRRDNVVNSLLRHDWLHRWRTVLDTAGLEPTPAFHRRETLLRQLAEMADT
ncbi:MAG: glycosyltransferase family protein [Verrucomicrobiales bacterium]|nr:glycosyltransferase [Verrucomicrobiota bacterium JB025]